MDSKKVHLFQNGAKECHSFSSGDSTQVHCVDLGESFPTSFHLQNLAAIQPRTSLVKFAHSPRTDPPGSQSPSTSSTTKLLSGQSTAAQSARERSSKPSRTSTTRSVGASSRTSCKKYPSPASFDSSDDEAVNVFGLLRPPCAWLAGGSNYFRRAS